MIASGMSMMMSSLTDQELTQFSEFKSQFNKHYESSQEHAKRAAIFAQNLKLVQMMNEENEKRNGEARVYSHLTPFMDLTVQEFKAHYLMKPEHFANKGDLLASSVWNRSKDQSPKKKSSIGALPDAFDWRDHGAVTPVKNQASCGSCWAFSAVQAIEGAWFLAGNPLTELAPQQLVDCDNRDCGCYGGWYFHGWEYLLANTKGGIAAERDYRYCIPPLGTCFPCVANTALCGEQTFCNTTCKANVTLSAFISGYQNVTSQDEDVIAQHLVEHGPLSVALNAMWLQFYHSGVSDPAYCPGDLDSLDHAVLLVGFGVRTNWLGEKQKYWIVKNSWAETWGMKGYFELVRGKSKCGINQLVAFPLVNKK